MRYKNRDWILEGIRAAVDADMYDFSPLQTVFEKRGEAAVQMKLKCETCKCNPSLHYCEKLNHPLENGYAMKYHAQTCGATGAET